MGFGQVSRGTTLRNRFALPGGINDIAGLRRLENRALIQGGSPPVEELE